MSHNTIEINLTALTENYAAIQRKVGPNVKILAMVKSDGYGHGLVQVAQAVAGVGASSFGVAEVEEGIALRDAGISGEIVVLLGSAAYREIIHYALSPVVFDADNLVGLSEAALVQGRQVGVHLKIDVGMGRLGIMPRQVPSFLQMIAGLPGVFLAGVMGHLPVADDPAAAQLTSDQCGHFIHLTLGQSNLHIANSAALIDYPASLLHMVRPGISLYGCYPSGYLECRGQLVLRPAMSFKTRIIQVKDVPAGHGVSYGHLFVTERPSRLAVLPVGYADGYLRALTGHAEVLVRGRRVPVCGRICMNACLIDITDIEGARVDEEVVLMGSQVADGKAAQGAPITADEIAAWMGTINYEVLCLFGRNNKRLYTTKV